MSTKTQWLLNQNLPTNNAIPPISEHTLSESEQISALECVKLLCIKLSESSLVKLILLVFFLYFGGLIWFFYAHSTSWGQLFHLCHESSNEFISTVNKEYYHFYDQIQEQNANQDWECHSNDILNCEMERQQKAQRSKKKTGAKNREFCMDHIRDENYEKMTIKAKVSERHKHKSLNELLFEIQRPKSDKHSLCMELNTNEIKSEFIDEYNDCVGKASKYWTDFAPILGFHILCFYNFGDHKQSLVIAYQNGYSKSQIPSIPYKNRKKCIARNIENVSYYVTNDCEREMTMNKTPNPKFLLIGFNNFNIKSLRRHLQNHLLFDIGSYDQYTIEGLDIFSVQSTSEDSNTESPTKSPETEKLYEKLEFNRNSNAKYYESDPNPQMIVSQYRKNPFSLYYPNGKSISFFNKMNSNSAKNEFPLHKSVVFMFEGGRFIWPGIKVGHVISLPIGPNIALKTLNMRPLIFEVMGLITDGEVEYVRNKSFSRFNRSEVGLNEEKKVSESRTCESAWLFGEQDIIVNSLKSRCEKILQIPKSHMEDMEVVRYKRGQRFDMHYDAFQAHDANSKQSQILLHGGFKNRIATILYYLSDLKSAQSKCHGFTVFPRYDQNIIFDQNGIEHYEMGQNNQTYNVLAEKCYCNESNPANNGLKIVPRNGKTILFYNMLPNGELDPAALHGGCSLVSGQKWAANQWIWNRPFNR